MPPIWPSSRRLLLVVALAVSFPVHGQPLIFQSSTRQTALLELYTSEGCSSCPPAEQWLSGLKSSSSLWTNFVPVAFHVDYWDHLGWPDPWSRKEYSERQRSYAEAWSTRSIYTPGFVLNGKEWQNWSKSNEIPGSTKTVGTLKVSSASPDRWTVEFAPTQNARAHHEACAALLAGGLVSEVRAGENRGRRLTHDFTVLKLTTVTLQNRGNAFQGELALTPDSRNQKQQLALAVWVTSAGQPVQATGGWLSSPH